MPDIRFYHLEQQTLEDALPGLLSKALEKGHRIVIKTSSEQEAESLNNHLWTYDPNSFLPHGTAKEGFKEDQPVWLTCEDENPNGADVLILTHGTESDNVESYTLCCEMLNGKNPDHIQKARSRWQSYKENGYAVTYWQQTAKGWDKKAG